MAEWLCSRLQPCLSLFDSGCHLQIRIASSSRTVRLQTGKMWVQVLHGPPTRRFMFCVICSAPLRSGRICCSLLCAAELKYRTYISEWLAGNNDGLKCRKTFQPSSHVRRYLLHKTNSSCEECGWNKTHPVDGRPLVEIDHIDGDASNTTPDNLRVLCPNCHSMTPTFRARNKKSKRKRSPSVDSDTDSL